MENRRQNKTVRNGQVKRIALAAVLSVVGTSLFAAESQLAGWKTSPNTSAREENGKVVVSVTKGQGSIYRYVYGKVGFIQLRISSNTRFYVQGKEFQLPPVFPKPGLYTIPASGKVQRMAAFNLRIMGKEFAFSEFLSSEQPPAYSVTVQKEGDEIVVSMPVKDKPDSLTLTLYALNTGKNWKFTGMWKMLDWPGVPSRLTQEEDGIYRARFKLPKLSQNFSASALTMIAGVHMTGADNLDCGDFYGFFPFAVNIQGSREITKDERLKIYDLGAVSALHDGAVRGDKSLVWKGLTQFRGSRWRSAYKDQMISSWAEISPGKKASAILKLPKGKYHLAIGIGSHTLPDYAAHRHDPTSGCVKVNGKEIFRRNSSGQNRDLFLRRIPDEKDNFFRIFFKDLIFFDLDAEAEAGENGIQLEFIADPEKIMVLNYIIVHPAGDQTAADRLAKIRAVRENRWNQFLVNVEQPQKPFAMNTPFAVFPRENPDDNVCPNTLPSPVEKNSPLMLFGAAGEMLSGTFFVRTGAKELKGATVKLSGLPGNLFQIMYVHYSTPSERRNIIYANHLLPAEPADLKPNYSYAWRIRLKGPAKPGKYCGNIEVTADGHTEKLPVEVNIHPLALPELNDHYIAMDGDGVCGRNALPLMRFAKEYLGCNTAHLRMAWPTASWFELDRDGMPVKALGVGGYGAKRYDAWLDAYIAAGFPIKTPWIGYMSIASQKEPFKQGPFKPFTKEYCQAVKLSHEFLRDRAQKKGLDGILVDFGGEMGYGLHVPSERTIASAIRLFKLVTGMPGIKTSYRCNCYATVERFNDCLDFQGVRDPHSWKSSDRITDYGKKKHIYSYSVTGRVRNGLHSWAHGARGNLREYLIWDHEFYRLKPLMDGVAPLTSSEAMMCGEDKPLMTVRTEAFRASVVDRQYLRILDNAVKDAPNSPAKAKAVALRDLLRNTSLSWNMPPTARGNSPWEGMRLDLMRQAIVECVLNLKKNDASAIPDYRKVAVRNTTVKPEAPKVDPGTVPEEAKADYQDSWWADIKTGPWETQGYAYDGVAWYRKSFELKELDNPRINFAGVDEQAWVWLNGKFLGHHNGWDQAFSFPLDQAAVKGKNNLSVLVFDSSFQGGIWRPVTVVNGGQKLVLNDWKFILKPGRQDLNEFQLKDGPLTPAGSKTLTLNIMLYGFRDVRMSPEMEIWLDGRKLSLKAVPYKRIVREIPVDPVGRGHHQLILKSNGKTAMTYDFYGI